MMTEGRVKTSTTAHQASSGALWWVLSAYHITKGDNTMLTYQQWEKAFCDKDGFLDCRHDMNEIMEKWNAYCHEHVTVGDGMTVNWYTDREAYTVIKRTAKTLVLQRDKATLSPDWKPHFIPGGFCGTVINQNEQEYIYEPDPDGRIIRAFWSEKDKRYKWQGLYLSYGRNEFYDYNF